MVRDRFVFWLVDLTPHQAPFIREISARLPPGRVIGVFQRPQSAARFAKGWSALDYGQTEVIVAPEEAQAEALLAADAERSVHIFSSMMHSPAISRALRRALATPETQVGLLSEARDWRGAKGFARQAHSLLHERRYRRRADFVLAIGGTGVEWFRRCGYPAAKIFPFCYVVESPPTAPPDPRIAADGALTGAPCQDVQIVFVGRLIQLKRVDLLLSALARVERSNWGLSIVGDGSESRRLKDQAVSRGLDTRVDFLGLQGNATIRSCLAEADLLVLPSRWDGWGAVVNEALMAGVPVICSDWCGASALIRAGWNGDVFRCGSVDDLAATLQRWIDRGRLPDDQREAIRTWSGCIAGPAVAGYVLDIVKFVSGSAAERPPPPWG